MNKGVKLISLLASVAVFGAGCTVNPYTREEQVGNAGKGAAIGAAVGAAAGLLTKGDKLDNALIGAGIGAIAVMLLFAGLDSLPDVGQRLRIGQALVEVTGPADPCKLMDQLIGDGAMRALAGLAGVQARVIEGGELRPGDPVGPA